MAENAGHAGEANRTRRGGVATAERSAAGPRVRRCFAFADLCGFTDYVDTYGDDAAVAELSALRATVREVASRCGVRVDKWLGDGVMLVGVDDEPVVRAVLQLREEASGRVRLPVRAGVAAGPVLLLEGDDYVGRSVNLAARLSDLADAGQVLAPFGDVSLPDGVTAETVATLDVRGFRRPIVAVALHA
ncbi:MAG: adenylate/guanylate cyclase domain-containing protein [Acidimicrobiales bacterium]